MAERDPTDPAGPPPEDESAGGGGAEEQTPSGEADAGHAPGSEASQAPEGAQGTGPSGGNADGASEAASPPPSPSPSPQDSIDEALAAAQAAVAGLQGDVSGADAGGDAGEPARGGSAPGGGGGGSSGERDETPVSFELPPLDSQGSGQGGEEIDLLSDVNLNVKIELGRTRMLVEDVLKLGDGAVVELDKLAGDPVDVYVNDRLIAKGEVLVLNDNFCVRINEIVDGSAATEEARRRA